MTDNQQARAKIVADHYAEFPKGSTGSVKIGTETGTQRTRYYLHSQGGANTAGGDGVLLQRNGLRNE